MVMFTGTLKLIARTIPQAAATIMAIMEATPTVSRRQNAHIANYATPKQQMNVGNSRLMPHHFQPTGNLLQSTAKPTTIKLPTTLRPPDTFLLPAEGAWNRRPLSSGSQAT